MKHLASHPELWPHLPLYVLVFVITRIGVLALRVWQRMGNQIGADEGWVREKLIWSDACAPETTPALHGH